MEKEPGLLKREVVGFEGNKVVIREIWDTSAPGCPMIVIRGDQGIYARETILHQAEYDALYSEREI